MSERQKIKEIKEDKYSPQANLENDVKASGWQTSTRFLGWVVH